ncbi:MAG: universal stress protein, partial [Acidobacteriota bacterium]
MEVRTILWPTDLSPGSLKASGHVLSLVEKYGALVVVMYVSVDLCSYFPAYGNYPSPDLIQEFQGWEVEQAK